MGLFNKKKEKPHILDRGLLAEAITIYSDKIDLSDMKRENKKHQYPEDTICLNEHLTVKVDSAWYTSDNSWFMGCYCVLDYFSLNISTYVDGIKMASYKFCLDMKSNDEMYRRWECEEKEIVHYMPNQFIDFMNEWSNSIVLAFKERQNKENRKKEAIRQKRYSEEESILDKYR